MSRRWVLLIVVVGLISSWLIVGCGQLFTPSHSGGTGALSVDVAWPQQETAGRVVGKVIPVGTNSILIRLNQAGNELTNLHTVIARQPSETAVHKVIEGIPVGSTQVIVTAQTASDGTGSELTRWLGDVMIRAGVVSDLVVDLPTATPTPTPTTQPPDRYWTYEVSHAERVPEPDIPIYNYGQQIGTGNLLVLYYRVSDTHFPAVFAIYSSGFIRMAPATDPATNFGTSAILGPAYWQNSQYFHNGTLSEIRASIPWGNSKPTLECTAAIGALAVSYLITLQLPTADETTCHVRESLPDVVLDANHQALHEGYKLVQLSSMYIDESYHDSDALHYVGLSGSQRTDLVNRDGFILTNPGQLSEPWLELAHSDWAGWQGATPSVSVTLTRPSSTPNCVAQGWVRATSDTNNDNVSAWINWDSAPAHCHGLTLEYDIRAKSTPTQPSPTTAVWERVGSPGDIRQMVTLGNKLFAPRGDYLYRSDDLGTSWQENPVGLSTGQINRLEVDQDKLYIACRNGLCVTDNSGESFRWDFHWTWDGCADVDFQDGTGWMYVPSYGSASGTQYKPPGGSWQLRRYWEGGRVIADPVDPQNIAYVGGSRTIDGGANWHICPQPLYGTVWQGLPTIFQCNKFSQDRGETWQDLGIGTGSSKGAIIKDASSDILFAARENGGIYRGTPGQWVFLGLATHYVYYVVIADGKLLAVGWQGQVFRTSVN